MARRDKYQSTLTPPQHPPKPPNEGLQFWKVISKLLLFVIIHQLFGN